MKKLQPSPVLRRQNQVFSEKSKDSSTLSFSMRKTSAILITIHMLCSCNRETKVRKESEQLPPAPVEIIEISLKAIQDSFDFRRDNEYAMNQKYVGKTLRIIGRTSGVTEEGVLNLQIAPYEEPVRCYGINDPVFLTSVKKDDIVVITGVLGREKSPIIGNLCVLQDCISWEKAE